MAWEQIVGANVRKARRSRGLSQEQLALRAGMDLRYLGGIERGELNPTVSVLGKLSGVLQISPSLLFDTEQAQVENISTSDQNVGE